MGWVETPSKLFLAVFLSILQDLLVTNKPFCSGIIRPLTFLPPYFILFLCSRNLSAQSHQSVLSLVWPWCCKIIYSLILCLSQMGCWTTRGLQCRGFLQSSNLCSILHCMLHYCSALNGTLWMRTSSVGICWCSWGLGSKAINKASRSFRVHSAWERPLISPSPCWNMKGLTSACWANCESHVGGPFSGRCEIFAKVHCKL